MLLPLLTGGAAYASSSRQRPLYSAKATLLINPGQTSSTTSLADVQVGQNLAVTYQQLVVTEPVLQPVVDQLTLPYSAAALAKKVSAASVSDTQLLRISVSDPNPKRAAEIANAVAAQFASFITEQTRETTNTSQSAFQGFLDTTQKQINQLNSQILALQAATSTPGSEAQLDGLRSRLNQLETSYATFLLQSQQLEVSSATASTKVRVSVPATVPQAPYAPRIAFYTVLAAFIGGLLALGLVALLEYLDNTVKPSLNFQELTGAPLLSIINTIPKLHQGKDQLFVLSQPKSNTAEAIRLLRTNVEFAAVSREISSLTVTSAGPGEGKSTVTANLAAAMAQRGFTVAVLDADLRRPSQHKIFGLRNDRGVTSLLTHPDMPWIAVATEMIEGRLFVIPSGPIPPNPGDLLGSERFQGLLSQIKEQVDIVLVDTPPVLAVSDPLVVSTSTSGVMLVCRANRTRVEALQRAAGSFPESVRRVGIVLNQQDKRGGETYYYYSGYYGPDDQSVVGDSPAVKTAPAMLRPASLDRITDATSEN